MICPCHSGLSYTECCGPYHKGEMIPESALVLMRSRYSAYALKLPDYIIETTHKDGSAYHSNLSEWKDSILFFSNKTEYHDLKIIEFLEGTEEAFVVFHAHLFRDGKNTSFTENSRFFKIGDRWYYHSGNVEKHRPS